MSTEFEKELEQELGMTNSLEALLTGAGLGALSGGPQDDPGKQSQFLNVMAPGVSQGLGGRGGQSVTGLIPHRPNIGEAEPSLSTLMQAL